MKRIINIKHPSGLAKEKAGAHIDSLVKPIGSLGMLETYAVKLAGIFGRTDIPDLKKAVAVFAADNGIWEEGITSVPQSVTAMQARNMTKGLTGINVIAGAAGADVFVYDMGIKDFEGVKGVEDRRIGNGTHNIARGAAMDIGQAVKAIAFGIDAAEALWSKGYRLVGCGEMGICNTATSAAVVSVLAGVPLKQVVGKGAGITDEMLDKKTQVIERAIAVNHPEKDNALDVLAKLGGFDIAAMTGFFIGAAYKQMAAVIDGFISAAAALAASRLNPVVTEYLFASHTSPEPGFNAAMQALDMTPPLKLDMRLGEGSGCPLMFGILDASVAVMKKMGTFKEARIDMANLVDIRDKKKE